MDSAGREKVLTAEREERQKKAAEITRITAEAPLFAELEDEIKKLLPRLDRLGIPHDEVTQKLFALALLRW